MQVENPFVESIQSLQQAEDSPLAAMEIGHLPVLSKPYFPRQVHHARCMFQVPQEARAPRAAELQV